MSERYTLIGKIGQGGIGAVYRAFDTSLQRDVAIKRLLCQDDKPEDERSTAEILIREAGMLSKLQHPNIVTVYDVGIDTEGGYVVMELIDGETFDVTIGRGALTATDFAQVVDQTLEALIAAQQIDMLHRDIKPSNVMITWLPSGRFQVKVLDFGLAKLSKTPALQTINHGDSIMGSIYFMAPEQFDREPLDARTDLYSLGCLYYYGLTRQYPFDGKSASDVMIAHIEHDVRQLSTMRPDLPREVCDWVMRLISNEMDARPYSASEAQRQFEPGLAAIREAARPNAGAIVQVPVTAPPSPNRPQLITGPVTQLHHSSPMLVSTGYRLPLKKRKSPVFAFLFWMFLALAATAIGWAIFYDENAAGARGLEREDSGSGQPPSPARPLPERIDRAPRSPAQNFVNENSGWRYFDQDVERPLWFLPAFDDSKWPRGNSPLGFGDKVKTVIRKPDSEDPPRITYYFRKSIIVGNAPTADDSGAFIAKIQFDDAFRMYLNGKEILRSGFEKEGPIGPETTGIRRGTPAQEMEWVSFKLPSDNMKDGKNVFAVEVHQTSLTSSDVRFSMTLDYVEKPG